MTKSVIIGKALIFWDKEKKNKLDKIDTDQITPADDCVCDDLSNIDKYWKEGTFRYLMPDFKQKIAEGYNFIVVRDYFGIGSSREMSPAGILGIAKELDTKIIIICGENIGKIFYNNACSLGLTIIQCKQASIDAMDDDDFSYEPNKNKLSNLTQNKAYTLIVKSSVEEKITQSGGLIKLGQQLYQTHQLRKVDWSCINSSDNLSMTEKILMAHRYNQKAKLERNKPIEIIGDLFPASDGTAPFSIYAFNEITKGNLTASPINPVIINDHFVYTGIASHNRQIQLSEQFAKQHKFSANQYPKIGSGIFHFYLPQQGMIKPGQVVFGADSHSRTYGAYGALGIGVGSTALGFGWALGYSFFTLQRLWRVNFRGRLNPWVSGKDIILYLLKQWHANPPHNVCVEFSDVQKQLTMTDRHTIANMMAEAEAATSLFISDIITKNWFKDNHNYECCLDLNPGKNTYYDNEFNYSLENIPLQVAIPYSPSNSFDITDIELKKIIVDKAIIGSCTNGSYRDLYDAAKVLFKAKNLGIECLAKPLFIYPGSRLVVDLLSKPIAEFSGLSIREVFESFHAQIREPWCGPCFGQGVDALQPGEKAITSFNRNWENRMGKGGLGYLASPAVVTASALLGYIGSPTAIGGVDE